MEGYCFVFRILTTNNINKVNIDFDPKCQIQEIFTFSYFQWMYVKSFAPKTLQFH